jgi:phage I-like protein
MVKRYKSIDFKPPKGVSLNAARGLDLRRRFGKGGLTTQEAGKLKIGSGVARATSLKNLENVSPETIKKMVGFFNRHEVYKKNHIKKEPYSASYISWLLWGGDEGQRWANKTLRQMQKADEASLSEKIIQTIIVDKVNGVGLEQAKKKALKYGSKNPIPKVHETEKSFMFRQVDPSKFIKDSFSAFKVPEQGVRIIYGKLKDATMSEFRTSPNLIKFSEENLPDKIQILRAGNFYHEGREIEVKKNDLISMVQNFSEKVRGIDLMIDFSHNSEGEAAGWIKKLMLSDDKNELWAEVDWTKAGQDSLKNKAFKYISADFSFAYKDNESLKDHGPTLFGAGLTNRPVVKSMEPIVLSELNINPNKEDKMGYEAKEMQEEEMMSLEDAMKMIRDLKDDLLKKDEELISMRKELEEGMLKGEEKLAEIKKEKELMTKNQAFDKKLSEGVVVEAQRQAFIDNDMEKFLSLQADIKLSEKGNSQTPKSELFNESNYEDKIIELAEKRAKEENISIEVAISRELQLNPKAEKFYNSLV